MLLHSFLVNYRLREFCFQNCTICWLFGVFIWLIQGKLTDSVCTNAALRRLVFFKRRINPISFVKNIFLFMQDNQSCSESLKFRRYFQKHCEHHLKELNELNVLIEVLLTEYNEVPNLSRVFYFKKIYCNH